MLSNRNTEVITSDGLTLSACLTRPQGVARGAILIIPGSGNVGMDGDVSGAFLGRPYLAPNAELSRQIAETLTEAGFATLRYAKRGVENPEEFPHQTLPYLIRDAREAFELLRSQFPEIECGIVGFSEGASIALIVGAQAQASAVFQLSPIVKRFDEAVAYQFKDWPIYLLQRKLPQKPPGVFARESVLKTGIACLPLTALPWSELKTKTPGEISIADDLAPFYETLYKNIVSLAEGPELGAWYQSMLGLPNFQDSANAFAGSLHIYTAVEDAQSFWQWTRDAVATLERAPQVRYFAEGGHCFSPHAGALGEIKTSGPLSNEVLASLATDLRETFKTQPSQNSHRQFHRELPLG